MGIKIKTNTNMKESLKLLNHVNSFLFEQEFGELKNFSPVQINRLKDISKILAMVIKNN